MPIVRTYQCGECFHRIEVTLPSEAWDDPPPDCPACTAREMNQEFKPVAIGGSARSKAVKIASKIAEEDYGVADMQLDGKEGHPAQRVRYKDSHNSPAAHLPSEWTADSGIMASAMARGREMRQKHGDGLDVLQNALKTGAQPDLIEASKRRALRVT